MHYIVEKYVKTWYYEAKGFKGCDITETLVADRPVYIIVSQTGTILSRVLKLITRKQYNHASISFNEDLKTMYSFGRIRPYNPFLAGFVTESANFGTFKRFKNTRVLVVELLVPENKYEDLKTFVEEMLKHPEKYGYNYLGLYLAALKISFKSDNRYYCSEFVKEILVSQDIDGANKLKKIIHPMSFLDLPKTQVIYEGLLREYNCS